MASWWSMHARTRTDKLGHKLGQRLLASAALTSKDQVRAAVSKRVDWQKEAWDLYDQVPEVRYGINWRANAISRARLYVGKIDPDGSSRPHPLSEDDTPYFNTLMAPLEELAGGQLGQSQLLRRMSIHYDVPGETWLLGFFDEETGENRWILASNDEATGDGTGRMKVKDPDEPSRWITLDPDDGRSSIIHLWNPHPRDATRPDSPLMALRNPAKELLDISAHIQATAESRLAGAGILKVPDGVSLPSPEQSEGVNPTHSSNFVAALIQAMAAPLKNRDDASAIVPITATGPAEALAKMEHMSFATDFDANASTLREAAIRRLAIGLDTPPEVLLGLSTANHWSAWAISDDALKVHLEPALGVMVDALTEHFYQPALAEMGIVDHQEWVIWYDVSELKQRPNRSPEAQKAYTDGVISAEAYRREIGFSDEDAPTPDEMDRRLLVQLALADPATYGNAALLALGQAGGFDRPVVEISRPAPTPELPPAPAAAPVAAGDAPATGQTGDGATGRGAPPTPMSVTLAAERPAGPDPWRLAVLEMAVLRGLARAGQYLINHTSRARRAQLQRMDRHAVHVTLTAHRDDLDAMLAGAFEEFHAATPDEPCLHRAVDEYVRALLVGGEAHRRDYLSPLLKQYGCQG